jgi:hypothetical protein
MYEEMISALKEAADDSSVVIATFTGNKFHVTLYMYTETGNLTLLCSKYEIYYQK